MSRRRCSPEEYTVGWISALPVELEAATQMLNEVHQDCDQGPGDANLYTLGSMGSHDVVIACLPTGSTGTNMAAAVAGQMKSKFSSLQFVLMVGVGGGAPSSLADVRLGDVVVSQPLTGRGGVVQYDFGKSTPSGFVRTGFLNAPPTRLLSALAKLQAKPSLKEGMLRAATQFQHLRQGLPDVLFEAAYAHEKGEHDCVFCDDSRILSRLARNSPESVIHYGVIASGNLVIRDGVARDQLSAELGGVLCFEMEAAGLMNVFPCLVIRGICDYADSHKNKKWQPYSAAMAAAFAKELLRVLPPVKMELTRSASDGLPVAAMRPQKALWIVPFCRNANFVGRQAQLDGLKDALFVGHHARVALTGLGGVGKTQIALELAYQVREKYPDCSVFWVPATSKKSLEQAYLDVGRQLGIPGLESEQTDTKELVRRRLSSRDSGRWLFVFDNADDVDMWTGAGGAGQQTRLIDHLPRSDQGCLVFTTRTRKVAVKLAQHNVVHVPQMDDVAARQLLERSVVDAGLLGDPDENSALLAELTYLPLAIRQAASYMNENDVAVPDYLSLIREEERDVIDLLSSEFEDEGRYDAIKNPVATTWIISLKQIQERHPLAAEYLSFMSLVDPRGIPQSLLPPAPSRRQELEAVGTLTAYSFVSRRSADSHFEMHRLVQLATRNWLRMEGQLEQETLKVLARLEQVFPSNDHEHRSIWRAYLPHARYLLESRTTDDGPAPNRNLVWKLGLCLHRDGKFKEAEKYLSEAVESSREALGEEHPDTLRRMDDLASTYRERGRWTEAEQLFTAVLQSRRSVLGEQDPDTFTTMDNLAWTYCNQGRWKHAEDLFRRVTEARKQTLGEKDASTLTSMANLAMTFWNHGHLKEAEELEVRVVEIRKTVLGLEHPDTLTSINNLASTYADQGRWEASEALDLQAMETREKVLGTEHPDTLTSMNNLATTYRIQGRWAAAEELCSRAASTLEQVMGQWHPSTLSCQTNLASIYREQGRLAESERLFHDVLEIQKLQLGADHPSTLTSSKGLSMTYKKQGRYDDAASLAREVITKGTAALGADHPNIITTRSHLSSVLWNQGRFEEAEELTSEVMALQRQTLNEEHPDMLYALDNWASVLAHHQRWEEAEAQFRDVLSVRERVFGADHPNTLRTQARLALLLQKQGRWEEADALESLVVSKSTAVLGSDHPSTLSVMHNRAVTLKGRGRHIEAYELMGTCAELRAAKLGSDHPRTRASVEALRAWNG